MAADLEHLNPVFRERIDRACAETGATVLSGARTPENQALLFAAAAVGGNPANKPGTSWHEFGADLPGDPMARAVDFINNDALTVVRSLAAEYRLCFPVAREPWHAQPVETRISSRFRNAPPLEGQPSTEESKLPMEFTYVFNGEDFLWLGAERIHTRCASPDVLEGLKSAKQIAGLGVKSQQFHDFLKGIASNAKFATG